MGRTYRIVNRGPVPATVSLSFRVLENLQPPDSLPVQATVEPQSSTVVLRLPRVVRDATISAVPTLQVDLGSDGTVHDDSVLYAPPFGGSEPRALVQAGRGGVSHLGDLRHALDFAMPEGTPVLAARAGVVVHIQDGFTEGGLDPELIERANVVVVGHTDGTMASYGHLSPGVAVRVGQRVEVGDRLGRSGATGVAGSPHLHFHVGRRLLGEPGRTLPVRLGTAAGEELELRVGASYPPTRERTGGR